MVCPKVPDSVFTNAELARNRNLRVNVARLQYQICGNDGRGIYFDLIKNGFLKALCLHLYSIKDRVQIFLKERSLIIRRELPRLICTDIGNDD